MGSTYHTPEEKARKEALRRIIKKVTGGVGVPKCQVCGELISDEDLLAENLVWSVGHGSAVQFHRECFQKKSGSV